MTSSAPGCLTYEATKRPCDLLRRTRKTSAYPASLLTVMDLLLNIPQTFAP